MLNGTPNEFTTFNDVAVPVKDQYLWYPFWGSERTFPHFAAGWTWAMDTPFKWVKQVPSHFGGTAQGVAMSWPGHIPEGGGIRRQFAHVIDIVPTILEATGIPAPAAIDGIALVGLGIACWPGPRQLGMLVYGAMVTLGLAQFDLAGVRQVRFSSPRSSCILLPTARQDGLLHGQWIFHPQSSGTANVFHIVDKGTHDGREFATAGEDQVDLDGRR